MHPDDPRSWDPYLRYRLKYPKFPGVKVCVDLLSRAKNDYLEGVFGDLVDHVTAAGTAEVVAAFREATDERIRSMLLEVVSKRPEPGDLSLLVDALAGPEWMLWDWAARGLHRLATPEARRALWDARSRTFADPEKTARYTQMLDAVKRGE